MGEAVTEFVVVLCTAPADGAKIFARALVQERLAACVNIMPVRSYFVWKGELAEESEDLMIIKTAASVVKLLKSRIKELHSYQVPEIIVLPIQEGYQPYLAWIAESVG